jgi:periplasmic protein TonB
MPNLRTLAVLLATLAAVLTHSANAQSVTSPGLGNTAATPAARPAPSMKDKGDSCVNVAITRLAPPYPKAALLRDIEGWVEFTFALDGSGVASDITILDSEPRDVFVKTTRYTMEQWTFQKDVVRSRCYLVLDFKLHN